MQRALHPQAADFFSPTYESARLRFRAAAAANGATLDALPLSATGPDGLPLTIDIAWLGPARPKQAILHSSGLHGAEGFTGSAIQLRALAAPPELPAGAALVLVHCLNPYGMAWNRRVNENNVDLNRNFLHSETRPETPPLYNRLDPLLNTPSPPCNDLFLLRMVPILARYGFRQLTQVVAGGQYTHPKGLFFGGQALQEGPQVFLKWLSDRLHGVETLTAIDIHTGLGRFADDVLFIESNPHDEKIKRLQNAYGDRVVAQQHSGAMYECRGSMLAALEGLFPSAKVEAACQEFGTYPSPFVLKALRAENRWHHFGGSGLDHPTKRRVLEVFNPASRRWRARILQLGEKRLQEAVGLLRSA
jgi:hypothetical protein